MEDVQETTQEVQETTKEVQETTEEVQETTEEVQETTDSTEETVTEATENGEDEVEYCCPCEFDDKEELCKMFVGGLSKETTDEEFKGMFENFGEIKEVSIIRKNETKSDRIFGFVIFAKCDNLDDCLLARPHKYKERELDVKRAVPKGQTDGSGHYKVKKLHIGGIPQPFNTVPLMKYLKSRHPKKYGTVDEIDILKLKDDPEKNRGFGFITVSSEDFADRIAIAETKFTLNGNELRINKAKPKASEAGAQQRGGFKGKGRGGFRGGRQGGGAYGDWGYSGYGAGYGYGYDNGYGYGGGYDYYGYPSYGSYGGPPSRGGRGKRYAPY